MDLLVKTILDKMKIVFSQRLNVLSTDKHNPESRVLLNPFCPRSIKRTLL